MAVVIKPAPKLGWPSEELAEAMVWEVYGAEINYSDTSPQVVFTIPGNCEVVGIGCRIETAFDDMLSAYFSDCDDNILLQLSKTSLSDTSARPFTWRFDKYPTSDFGGGVDISFTWSAADAAAGVITPIMLYRLNSGTQKWAINDWR